MSSDTIRVGIVGSKFAASFHYDSLVRAGDLGARVVGVYSPTPENRQAFAEPRGIRAFDSYEAMLAEVDVVDVCSTADTHETCAVRAAQAGKHAIVEKPFTGCFGPPDADETWRGDLAPKTEMLDEAVASARRMIEAAEANGVRLMYAENWVYAPAVQKEVEVLRATQGQILWVIAEESHSGSHSPTYGIWRRSGGGALMGKGSHPLSAVLYLKRVEGLARLGRPIRPKTVSARVHELTRNPGFVDAGFIRTEYHDIEDFCQVHIVFDDGFVADIYASEIVLGGVHNWIEVYANNHRTRCNINPVDACVLYNPAEEQLEDVYIAEKLGTKQGWSFASPDEHANSGYPQEIRDFMGAIRDDREPESDGRLGADSVCCMYAAYLSAEKAGAEVEIPAL